LDAETEGLVRELSSADAVSRYRAATALGGPPVGTPTDRGPGDPAAARPLLVAATDSDKNVRNAVVRSLAALVKHAPGHAPLTEIAEALGAEQWRVRFAAARAYGLAGTGSPAELAPLLHDAEESVRWAAAQSLRQRGGAWSAPVSDPEALQLLEPALTDRAGSVRAQGIAGFGVLPHEEAAAAAVRATRDPHGWVRVYCILPLAAHAQFGVMVGLLDDPFPWVSGNAAAILGRERITDAVPALISTLRARNHHVRLAAATALGAIRDPRGLMPVVDLLERLTASRIRGDLARVLGEWGDQRALPVLERLASSAGGRDPNAPFQAARAVEAISASRRG
jgi:HEAT repeat protein